MLANEGDKVAEEVKKIFDLGVQEIGRCRKLNHWELIMLTTINVVSQIIREYPDIPQYWSTMKI